MKWYLDEEFKLDFPKIAYGDKAIFIGSCFSENIREKGTESGLNFVSTDFGTLFHPLPMARILSGLGNESEKFRIIENNGRFSSFDSSTKLYAFSETEMRQKLQSANDSLQRHLIEANYLFITFGSAMAYMLDDDYTVSNCHKLPFSQFRKEMTGLENLIGVYKKTLDYLKVSYPKLQIVCTVSPVRHSKEGLIENNRSKARLILLCEELAKMERVFYFPAYEMVVDQLRDYRFYTSDLVHPNEQAVEFIWSTFQKLFFDKSTMNLMQEVKKQRKYFAHQSIHPASEREKQIHQEKELKLAEFLRLNPEIIW